MGTGTWIHQLDRAERYLARFQRFATDGVPSAQIQDAVDDIYSFFVHCLHVADYLERDPAFAGKAKQYRNTQRDLKICRDIAIGIKHVTCDCYSNPAVFGTQMVKVTTGDGGNPAPPTSTFTPTIECGGQSLDGLKVGQDAMAAWRRFVQVQG